MTRIHLKQSVGALILVVGLTSLVGCGNATGNQPVTGEVTFQGKPLDSGSIQFFTTAGPAGPAGGAMITAGKYELPGVHGLPPGTYTVWINSPEPDPTDKSAFPATKERIPKSYNTQSKVTVEVRAGTANRFDFAIE